jgi:hypothetical protein
VMQGTRNDQGSDEEFCAWMWLYIFLACLLYRCLGQW